MPTDEPGLPDPDSQNGDKWMIGPHMLLGGNSRDTVNYEALLGEERAARVFSDPPYNVKVDGNVSGWARAGTASSGKPLGK